MLQRIQIGDSERIGNQRARRRSSARSDRNVAFAGVADEIPDDEEISGKLHLLNDGQFPRQTLFVFCQTVLQPSLGLEAAKRVQASRETFSRNMFEIAIQSESRGHIEVRERVADLFQPHVAAFRNAKGAGEHVRRIFKDAIHFVMALDEKSGALELHAVGVLDGLAGLYAQHHILGMRVVFAEVVAVIGRDHRQAEFLFQPEQVGVNAMLLLQALILDLEKEIVFAEDVAIGRRRISRRLVVIFHQALGDFPFQTSREPNQSFGVFCEKLLADARLVIEAAQGSFRSNLGQVAIALFVLSQHQ